MLTHEYLKNEVSQRITRIQTMLRAKDLGALIIVGAGAPDMLGSIRYITNAHLWGCRAFAILGQHDPEPWLEISSAYQAVWSQNEAAIDPKRVESPDDVLKRTTDLAAKYAGRSKRIGLVNADRMLSASEYRMMSSQLDGFNLVEITDDFNRIRQIKSPFEIEAMIQNGHILDAAMDVFRDNARVGRRYWDVCAATEAYIKGKGSFWGRTKLSFGTTPQTVPAPKDQVMKESDVVNFEVVYESPWGYWLEMTTIFSFKELPDEVYEMLQAHLRAIYNSSALAKPGNTLQMISEANDQTFINLGFPVAGKHTPDCHTIGLDGYDGPSLWVPETVLEANMVLSFHPGTVMEGNRGLLISDNFLVTPQGGVRLSPHTAERYYLRITE